MKKIMIEDTVEFRIGDRHLYGVVIKESIDTEGNKVLTILAGKILFHNIHEEDVVKDYGKSI